MAHFFKKTVQNLLKKHRVFPKKWLGQNFLIDKRALRKIILAADLRPKDIILEIGPGTGFLTQELAKNVKPARQSAEASRRQAGGKVIAVEKDKKMAEILREELKGFQNIKIIQADILKIDPKRCNLKAKSFKVVANLPYYITSPVVRKFLENIRPPKLMVLMVQKEVAQRICAKPPNMNLLAVSVQFYAKPRIISYISKKSFWPQPKVDSAIIKIVPYGSTKASRKSRLFFKIVKAGFSQPRKKIINNLSKNLKVDRQKIKNWLLENRIQPSQRAETLALKNWLKIVKAFDFA